jgi:hypothetical protein
MSGESAMQTWVAWAVAAAIGVAAVATFGEADARPRRNGTVVIVGGATPPPHPYGLYGYPVYGYSPIATDPLCIWRHQLACNPWFCQDRKMRICY